MATRLYRQGIPLYEFECAILLGCARRELQEHEEPLQPIRSLRYFAPVLEEVRSQPVDPRYVLYLREKLSRLEREKLSFCCFARNNRKKTSTSSWHRAAASIAMVEQISR